MAYPEKEVWNVYELFRTRFNLHKRAYQHRVSNAIERMLCDVLSAEEAGFMYHSKNCPRPWTVGRLRYLTDSVFDVIDFLAVEDALSSGGAAGVSGGANSTSMGRESCCP